ncbi:MAG: 1-(5-phosphoribosyl)-5-[(5-phosphoribosylamino)methylideneamino]imidazole-4-carboxamide isomerase [Deltaproteobacteria bacterium]|nr:1-(5-phosphoribosyl)-5-[(5-phosphoribosylamino)methylideneamino]imidazole-4-carboxamide isomerase [Deltaproteobacteria bacterium]
MKACVVYPAIDLRRGKVVRLAEGDPARQTTYGDDPAAVAEAWLAAGSRWLHVVNLDGAFDEADAGNRQAVRAILERATGEGASVQLGGGLRSLAAVEEALALGVARVVLGTAAVEKPELVREALARFGSVRVAVGLDARDGLVRTRGWRDGAGVAPDELARGFGEDGLRTVIYTEISRDGLGTGVDVPACAALASATGLEVIASGGVGSLEDLRRVRAAGLPGVIVGRALYDGRFGLEEALAAVGEGR